MALQAWGPLGYFDPATWGEEPWEGVILNVEGERLPSLLNSAFQLGAGKREGGTGARNWKRKAEKEPGEINL